MAHKKAGGSTRNGRNSNPQYRGCKVFAGQVVTAGSIIVRQCGNKLWAGLNAAEGRDCTIYAKIDGIVKYDQRGKRERRYIDILPAEVAAN
ncbi:TPA: 50S ribosomal protein L27 [Candidatus Sumerlaeota bacterium]|jgi:large subunit ribosomal protein L27|nr:50S ribosomal protein L27 [Candidatus Sumerlaeota bacterium]